MQALSASKPSHSIEAAILAGVFAHRIRPGQRLGEAELATLFGVSRTGVREAMKGLEARRIVEVRPRRGWFVVEPSSDEAREVFDARRVLETGLLRTLSAPLPPSALDAVRDHLRQETEALAAGDRPLLICLMGDFHIRLAELARNGVVTAITRDLTARTILISTLYQSQEHAAGSHAGHRRIFEALVSGDHEEAARLATAHLDEVEAGLRLDMRKDPLADLRRSLGFPLLPPTAPPNGTAAASPQGPASL